MSPILGIVASAKPRITALDGFVGIDSYTFPNSSTNTVTFSNINQGYKHLYIVFQGAGTINDGMRMYFNGDTTNGNYFGTGTIGADNSNAFVAAPASSQGIVDVFTLLGGTYGATQSSAGVAYINDYAATNKKKTVTGIQSNVNSSNEGWVGTTVGARTADTAAITSITFTARTQNFVANSSFALFGIK